MRNQTQFFRSTTLVFALLFILSAAPAYAAYELNETIFSAVGNTASGSTWELHNSVGEPAVGQGYGKIYALQAGFFYDYFSPAPTPTSTPTEKPTTTRVENNRHLKIYNSLLRPFKGEVARIRWAQPENGPTTIRIYNILGELVKTLVNGEHFTNTQEHEVKWDGRSKSGQRVGSGTYIVHIKSGSYQDRKKMIVVN